MTKAELTAPVRGTHGDPPRWIPPPPGLVKINVDAATSKNSRKVVATAIASDVAGNFPGASTRVICGLSDAEIVEAIACKEGLALASDIMVQHFKLASDNVNAIRGIKEDGMAAHGHIIREIQARAAYFETSIFVHENRRSNIDAHYIARSAIYSEFGR